MSVRAPVLIVNVAGVGYQIEAPMPTIYELPAVGEQVELHTHFVVREDAQLLYGFLGVKERDIFRELLKISGVGPKVALAILSTFTAKDFFSCIASEDMAQLVAVPGIGKKTAERLMVEMKNRFADQVSGVDDQLGGQEASIKQDATDALQALGYKPNDIFRALKGMDIKDLSSEQIIRRGLQVLSGRVL